MKKFLAFLMIGMIAAFSTSPCYAADSVPETTTTVYQLDNGITVERTIIESDISTFATKQKRGTATQTYRMGSDVIATVSLTATFWYDGSDSGVVSASSSHTTYDSWKYKNESIWDSGDTAYLSAELEHSIGNADVDLSLSCSPTGQLS